jgi:hypothetical protein
MYYLVLVTLFLLSLLYVNGAAKGNLEEITHKVFFDISIDGEPAGRITFGLCKLFIHYIFYLINSILSLKLVKQFQRLQKISGK